MAALTRGSLPPSVYWRRRLVVLTIAVVLLWTLVHLLGGGGDDRTPKAKPVADVSGALTDTSATPTPTATTSTSTSAVPTPTPTPTPTPEPLPTSTGACPPSDVSVTPSVTNAVAGSDVTVLLTLQTFNTPACTWEVSHKTMQVKITTSGGEEVWSTIQCKTALPATTVTLYQQQPTPVTMLWSSREADATCSTHTDWVDPGTYQVTGVALGGQPDEASFDLALEAPAQPVVTPSSTPSPTAGATPGATPGATASAKPGVTAKPGATATAKAKKKPAIAD